MSAGALATLRNPLVAAAAAALCACAGPVHKAARDGNAATLSALLASGKHGEKCGPCHGGGHSTTALGCAAEQGQLEAMRALLSAGSDPNARSCSPYESPLLLAAPPPAIPAVAQRHADRAQAFVKLAKDEGAFARAAEEFAQAADAAPWWAETHFNLGLAWEKAGQPGRAARSLQRFLQAAPEAPEAADVRQKIVELEVAQELRSNRSGSSVDDPAVPRAGAAEKKERERSGRIGPSPYGKRKF